MIRLSRLRRVFVLLALVVGGCERGHVCTLIGCRDGLTISLDGRFDVGTTYQVVVDSLPTPPESVPLLSCTLSPSDGGQELSCGPAGLGVQHIEIGRATFISDTTLRRVQITISSGGAPVTQTFDVAYTSSEINGPGCGVCIQAAIHVTIP